MTNGESPHITKMRARNRAVGQGNFLYEDADWMRAGYQDRGLTLRQLSVEAECSLRTIARWMEIHEIPTDRSRIGNFNSGADAYQWKVVRSPIMRSLVQAATNTLRGQRTHGGWLTKISRTR